MGKNLPGQSRMATGRAVWVGVKQLWVSPVHICLPGAEVSLVSCTVYHELALGLSLMVLVATGSQRWLWVVPTSSFAHSCAELDWFRNGTIG